MRVILVAILPTTPLITDVGTRLRNFGPLSGPLYESYYFGVLGPGFLNQVPTIPMLGGSGDLVTGYFKDL